MKELKDFHKELKALEKLCLTIIAIALFIVLALVVI